MEEEEKRRPSGSLRKEGMEKEGAAVEAKKETTDPARHAHWARRGEETQTGRWAQRAPAH